MSFLKGLASPWLRTIRMNLFSQECNSGGTHMLIIEVEIRKDYFLIPLPSQMS